MTSRDWQRGYQAARDDMQGRPQPGSACNVCGDPIPMSRGGGARTHCSRQCTVATAHARAKIRALAARAALEKKP